MSKKTNNEEKLTSSEIMVNKTNSWLSKHGKLLAIIAIAVLVVIIVVSIVTLVVNSSTKKTFDQLSQLQAKYDAYIVMDSEAEGYDEALPEIINDAEKLMSKGVKKYPGAKAALLLADIAYDDANYSEAAELYRSVADGQSKTFLREVALMSLAATLEDNNDKSGALDIYNSFFDEYGVNSFYSSRALFNAARLTEESDIALAISIYEQLVGEFGDYDSEYAKLAQSRIAQLN